jgi:sporulation protein YlmC with PRC-barrel domain
MTGRMQMTSAVAASAMLIALGWAAFAQAPALEVGHVLTNIPTDSVTITNYYKQDVYDPADAKIGEVADMLVDRDGRVTALIVAVGGFIGVGEKDVAVPFKAVRNAQKEGKWYLVMNATKDVLKAAPGYKYDRSKTQWVRDDK